MARHKNIPTRRPKNDDLVLLNKDGSERKRNKDGSVRKPRRAKAKTNALRMIRKTQSSTDNYLNATAMGRLIREIGSDVKPDIRFTKRAHLAIREASQAYLVECFQKAGALTRLRGKEVTEKYDLAMAAGFPEVNNDGTGWRQKQMQAKKEKHDYVVSEAQRRSARKLKKARTMNVVQQEEDNSLGEESE